MEAKADSVGGFMRMGAASRISSSYKIWVVLKTPQ